MESRQPIEAFLETTTDKALLAQKIRHLKNMETCSEYGVFEIFIEAKVNTIYSGGSKFVLLFGFPEILWYSK